MPLHDPSLSHAPPARAPRDASTARALPTPDEPSHQLARANEQLRAQAAELEVTVAELRRAHDALRESERHYRRLFDANPQPMWVFERETLEFLAVNDAAVAHYGFSREEFATMTVKDIRPAAEVPVLLAARAHAGEEGRHAPTGTFRHRRKDGRELLVEIVSHTIEWEGRPARLVLATDVTDREAASDAIRRSEARFRELADAVREVFYVAEQDAAGRLVRLEYVSPAFREVWGREPAAAYGDPAAFIATIHPDDRPLLEDGLPRAADGSHDVEYRVVRPDGSVRWVRDRAFAIRRAEGPSDGPVRVRVAGAVEDITSARAAAEAAARLAAIVEASDDAILSKSLDGVVQSWNAGAERLFGYAAGEVVGRTVLRIVPPERHGEEAELLRLVAAGEHVTQREVDRVRRDGTRVPVALTLSPIRDATGAVVAVSSIIRNVAERRRLEGELRQAQKMEAIGRLAGGIAHDFNNLLTAIRGNADLLLGELAPDTQARADVDEIRRAADRAAGLTRQLLAFSRKQVLQPRVLDVDEVVAGVDRLLCRVIGEDVRLRTLLRAGAGRVLADPGQLEQVLLNLAVNARDAMPGGGTLTIGTRLVPAPALPAPAAALRAPHGVVVITVADTGVGMDDATRARAFEPFFTTKDAGKGTGLGLATVFGIAQQSGGTVWLESEPGRGTTVSLALPVTAAARRAHTPAPGVPVVPGARGTVLLVEDEPAVRALVGRVLTGAGYRVLPAGDGRTAHAVWREHGGAAGGIDVVVSDLIMPERGGRELVALLREEHPALPVLFTSGYAEGGITAADLGARTAFLEKPFAAERMLGALAELLDARVSGPPARGR